MATPQGSDPSPQLACQNSGGGVFTTRVSLRHATMFTYSHANTPLGQSERAYYFSYFIKLFSKRQELCFSDATFKYCFSWWAYCFVGWKHGWKSRICLRSSWVAAWIKYSKCKANMICQNKAEALHLPERFCYSQCFAWLESLAVCSTLFHRL